MQFYKTVFIGMIMLISFGYCTGQDKGSTQCGTARGYYNELGKLSGRGVNPAVDTLKFRTALETKNYVLGVRPYYLTNASISDFTIAEPPANSSPQTIAEIAYLKQLEKGRTELEVDICKFMAGLSYNPRASEKDPDYKQYQRNLFQIGRSIGTWYNPDQLPATARLLGHVYEDASFFIWSFKYKYARIRPYTIDPTLSNLENTDWPAYPSGHAGHSYVTAMVLSMIAPEYHYVFMKDAYDIAHSREIIGVHFPSDSEASRVLACQLVEKLLADKRFLADLEQARLEWSMKASELN